MNSIGTVSSLLQISPLSEKTFQKLGSFIQSEYGIKMPPAKRVMLQGRLQKRLRSLGMTSYEAYCDYVLGGDSSAETVHLINAVSTNKTDFFREPEHFAYLCKDVLPALAAGRPREIRSPFNFWSAGCSTGEEPYTLAMVLSEFALENAGFTFRILGTDISTDVLTQAESAVYKKDRIAPVPMALRKKYLLKSKDPAAGSVRIVSSLRGQVTFQRLNFMHEFTVKEKMDVIFCRNVVIYFDKDVQRRLFIRFYDQLRPGGYLFIGHSETLNGLGTQFRQIAPTVYKKL